MGLYRTGRTTPRKALTMYVKYYKLHSALDLWPPKICSNGTLEEHVDLRVTLQRD